MPAYRFRDGRVLLEGDLTWQHIDALARKLLVLAGREGNMTIDLSAVQQCDSAGIAMLAACMAIKQRQQDRLRLVNVPARLTTLFVVYGLERAFAD